MSESNVSAAVTPRSRYLQLSWAACLAALVSAAGAADAPRAAASAAGKSPVPMLSKAQLRDCMAREEVVKADDAALVKEQAAVQVDKEAIAREGDAIKARLEAVDRTQAESVAAYNDAVEARNRRVEAFQARATAFNARVEANEQAHAAHAKDCSNRRYLEDDAAALKKGR